MDREVRPAAGGGAPTKRQSVTLPSRPPTASTASSLPAAVCLFAGSHATDATPPPGGAADASRCALVCAGDVSRRQVTAMTDTSRMEASARSAALPPPVSCVPRLRASRQVASLASDRGR